VAAELAISLSAAAKEAIAERVDEFHPDAVAKQWECGGFLLGQSSENITVATPGRASFPSPNELLLNYREGERAAERLGLRICGSWHSHPNGCSIASDGDRAHWAGLLSRYGLARVVGVIATSPRSLRGWVTYRGQSGDAVTRLARVL
jgi:proteasome lid subunit RPN8/RPN11